MNKLFALISILALVSYASFGQARVISTGQSGQTHFLLEEIYTGLGIPWGMAFLDNNTLLITERRGKLYRLNIDKKHATEIQGVPKLMASGQGGLLDIAMAPRLNPTQTSLYLTYSKNLRGRGVTALARATLSHDNRLEHWQDLFVAKGPNNSSRHYGSRIAFDHQGHVFVSIGDRGNRDDAQVLSNHAGTIIRLKLDGSIPSDNPFSTQAGALAEIWSYGHRNPQGLAFTPDKKRLWSIEHGPRGGDEINLIQPGKNYGWPIISYGKEYWGPIAVGEGTHKQGMEQPVKHYIPSIAPGSLIVYSGKAFKAWAGNLFAGALKMTHLNRVVVNAQGQAIAEERLFKDFGERIRALAEGPEGWIYLSTDSGSILRLRTK